MSELPSGSVNHCRALSTSLSNSSPADCRMELSAIHSAPGATPIESSAATPQIVPMTCVPCTSRSMGEVSPNPAPSRQHSPAGAKFPRHRAVSAGWSPSTPVSKLPTSAPVPSMSSSCHTRSASIARIPGATPIERGSGGCARAGETGTILSTRRSGSTISTSGRCASSRMPSIVPTTEIALSSQYDAEPRIAFRPRAAAMSLRIAACVRSAVSRSASTMRAWRSALVAPCARSSASSEATGACSFITIRALISSPASRSRDRASRLDARRPASAAGAVARRKTAAKKLGVRIGGVVLGHR